MFKYFSDSPNAGEPTCICSGCGKHIPDDGLGVTRIFDTEKNLEARFCRDCETIYLGIHRPQISEFPEEFIG